MTLKERMAFCTICKNRIPDLTIGLTCSLTNKKPEFEGNCESFLKDEKEAERKFKQKLDAAGNSRSKNGSLKPRKNINYGIFLLIAGIFVFLFSILFGVIIIIGGVSFILRGNEQKKIIKENHDFNEKL